MKRIIFILICVLGAAGSYGQVNNIQQPFTSFYHTVKVNKVAFIDTLDIGGIFITKDSTGNTVDNINIFPTIDPAIVWVRVTDNSSTLITSENNTYIFEDSINDPPVTFPAGTDTTYWMVGGAPTGIFVDHDFDVARYVDGVIDVFIDPTVNDWGLTLDDNFWHQYNGSTWPRRNPPDWKTIGNFGGGVLGSTNNSNVFLRYNNQNRIVLQNAGTRFPQLTGVSSGLMGLNVNGLARNVQIDTNTISIDSLAAGVLSVISGGSSGGSSNDSLKQVTARNGSSPSYVSIGDSITSTGTPTKSVIVYGTSITVGTGASSALKQYTNIVGVYAHANIINRGISSTTMQSTGNPADSSMVDRIYTIPVFDDAVYKGILFEYGTNDAPAFNDTTAFKTAFYRVIDSCIARGWPLNRIGILGIGFFNSGSFPLATIRNYALATRTIAEVNGVGLGDLLLIETEQGKLNNSVLFTDSLHPNDLGHSLNARAALNSLRFKHSTFFDVLGSSTASGFVQRQSGFLKIPTLRVIDSLGVSVADLLVGTNGNNNIYFGLPNLTSTGINNYSYGIGSFAANTTGSKNIGIGTNTLTANTTGNSRIAIGFSSQRYGAAADNSISIGEGTLSSVGLSGTNNIAIGTNALWANTSGLFNVAVGHEALLQNQGGYYNTAINAALQNNTSGTLNIGIFGLDANTTGSRNLSMGFWALRNANATSNIAIGIESLKSTTSGGTNISIGDQAAINNTTGAANVIIGHNAAQKKVTTDDSTATAINNSIYIGAGIFTGTRTPTNEIAIGQGITANGSNTTTIGTSATTDTWFGGTTKLHITLGTAPASASASGVAGTVIITTDYIYVCTATDTWKRSAISTW